MKGAVVQHEGLDKVLYVDEITAGAQGHLVKLLSVNTVSLLMTAFCFH